VGRVPPATPASVRRASPKRSGRPNLGRQVQIRRAARSARGRPSQTGRARRGPCGPRRPRGCGTSRRAPLEPPGRTPVRGAPHAGRSAVLRSRVGDHRTRAPPRTRRRGAACPLKADQRAIGPLWDGVRRGVAPVRGRRPARGGSHIAGACRSRGVAAGPVFGRPTGDRGVDADGQRWARRGWRSRTSVAATPPRWSSGRGCCPLRSKSQPTVAVVSPRRWRWLTLDQDDGGGHQADCRRLPFEAQQEWSDVTGWAVGTSCLSLQREWWQLARLHLYAAAVSYLTQGKESCLSSVLLKQLYRTAPHSFCRAVVDCA